MKDCETFIRGTIRFKGFSYIISAFHDLGLTSDEPVPDHVKHLRCLAESRLKDCKSCDKNSMINESINQVMMGISNEDECFTRRFLSKVDTSYLKPNEIVFAYKAII
jgi:hypothetical protein